MKDDSRTIQPETIRTDWSNVDPRWGIKTTPAMVMQLELAEGEYICGEEFDRRRDGSFLRLYPPIDRVAKKFMIPVRLLEEIAVRNRWNEQRIRFVEKVTAELRSIQAKVVAVTTERTIEIIDKALTDFGKAVDQEKIQIDSIQEFERLIRLREFLKGKAESRIEHQHSIMPLAEIQARFRGIQAEREEASLGMSGLLVDESPIDPGEPAQIPRTVPSSD